MLAQPSFGSPQVPRECHAAASHFLVFTPHACVSARCARPTHLTTDSAQQKAAFRRDRWLKTESRREHLAIHCARVPRAATRQIMYADVRTQAFNGHFARVASRLLPSFLPPCLSMLPRPFQRSRFSHLLISSPLLASRHNRLTPTPSDTPSASSLLRASGPLCVLALCQFPALQCPLLLGGEAWLVTAPEALQAQFFSRARALFSALARSLSFTFTGVSTDFCRSLPRSLALSPLSLSHTHTYTHTHILSLSFAHTLFFNFSSSLSHSRSLSPSSSLPPSLSLTHSLTPSLPSLSGSLSLAGSRSLSLSVSLVRSLSCLPLPVPLPFRKDNSFDSADGQLARLSWLIVSHTTRLSLAACGLD